MEKHIEIFCNANPITEYECPNCKAINKIRTKDLVKVKYTYTFNCCKCNESISINTKQLHDTLKLLKPFS